MKQSKQSDFCQPIVSSLIYKILRCVYCISRRSIDLPGMQVLLFALATLYCPRRILPTLALLVGSFCLRYRGLPRLPFCISYGAESLHGFTLLYYLHRTGAPSCSFIISLLFPFLHLLLKGKYIFYRQPKKYRLILASPWRGSWRVATDEVSPFEILNGFLENTG